MSAQGASPVSETPLSAQAEAMLKTFLRPYVLGVPSATLRAVVEVRGLLPVWRRARSSADRFAAIMSEAVVPSFPEYARIVRAGGVKVNDLHELGWRHAFGMQLRSHGNGPAFGVTQQCVLKTVLYEKHESRSEALVQANRRPTTAASWFQALDKQGYVPRTVVNRMLDLAGVTPGTSRRLAIDSLLTLKEYPSAIRDWLGKGMGGLTEAERRDVAHLMQVGPLITSEHLFNVAERGAELLAISHGLKEGSIAAMALSRKRTIRGTLIIMKMFPGATLDDVREVFDKDGKTIRVLAEDTTIPVTWKPHFESYSEKLLVERGIIEQTSGSNFLPTGIVYLRNRLRGLLGDDVDRSSFLTVLYPADRDTARGDSDRLIAVVRQLLNTCSGYINLDDRQKKQLFDTFKETLKSGPTFLDARLKIGASLGALGERQGRTVLSTREALGRLLTFLAFGN